MHGCTGIQLDNQTSFYLIHVVKMSFSSESEHALWKRLIDMGIFDDFYPLRLNACFRYLDVEKTQSFSLKVCSSTYISLIVCETNQFIAL